MIGQPDAGGPMTGGSYSLPGGFWVLTRRGPRGWAETGRGTGSHYDARLFPVNPRVAERAIVRGLALAGEHIVIAIRTGTTRLVPLTPDFEIFHILTRPDWRPDGKTAAGRSQRLLAGSFPPSRVNLTHTQVHFLLTVTFKLIQT